jgi:hypothetical protein
MCPVTTLAYSHRGYTFDYGPEDPAQTSTDNVPVTTAKYWHLLAQHGFEQRPDSYIHSREQTAQAH